VIRTRDGEALVSVSRIAEDDVDATDAQTANAGSTDSAAPVSEAGETNGSTVEGAEDTGE
jgi:hypothetical protein